MDPAAPFGLFIIMVTNDHYSVVGLLIPQLDPKIIILLLNQYCSTPFIMQTHMLYGTWHEFTFNNVISGGEGANQNAHNEKPVS